MNFITHEFDITNVEQANEEGRQISAPSLKAFFIAAMSVSCGLTVEELAPDPTNPEASPEQRAKASNLRKELSADVITWKTFVKGMRSLGYTKILISAS